MRLVIFDVDGTLVDSQELIVAAMTRGLRGAGLEPLPREAVLSIVGLSLPLAVEALLIGRAEGQVDEVVAGYREAYRQLKSDPAFAPPFFPGARETVEALAAEPETLLGIATGKSRRGLEGLLETTGLGPHFCTLQTADDAPSKPHPAMIRQAMFDAGTEKHDTTMVGDSVYDMEMAREAGVRAIGVSWGYNPVEALRAAGAQRIVTSFAELRAAVAEPLEVGSPA